MIGTPIKRDLTIRTLEGTQKKRDFNDRDPNKKGPINNKDLKRDLNEKEPSYRGNHIPLGLDRAKFLELWRTCIAFPAVTDQIQHSHSQGECQTYPLEEH